MEPGIRCQKNLMATLLHTAAFQLCTVLTIINFTVGTNELQYYQEFL